LSKEEKVKPVVRPGGGPRGKAGQSTEKGGVPRGNARGGPRGKAGGQSSENVIIFACGAAFQHCTNQSAANQMKQVVSGLPVTVVNLEWGGVKWEQAFNEGVRIAQQTRQRIGPNGKLIFSGQSAGAWLAAMVGTRTQFVDAIVSFYAPLDLPTLWQKNQWGKQMSARGPIMFMMPWGVSCPSNNPFCTYPAGDTWFWNTTNPNDPKNEAHMVQANNASPYSTFVSTSPPLYGAQGLEDGVIGQHNGVTQARRMINKLGNRRVDVLVECPGYAHAFSFNSPCTSNSLRNFIAKIIN